MRFYVKWSAWFDSHPYNRPKIAKLVRQAGGKNVRLANAYGWSNQPRVVTFSAPSSSKAEAIGRAVGRGLGTPWIIVSKKDWK